MTRPSSQNPGTVWDEVQAASRPALTQRQPSVSHAPSPEGGLRAASRAGAETSRPGHRRWEGGIHGSRQGRELTRGVTHWPPPLAAAGEATGVRAKTVPSGHLRPCPRSSSNNPAPRRRKPAAGTLGGAAPTSSGTHPAREINHNVIKSPPERSPGRGAGAAGS